jgi:hypothetical protein
MEKPLPADFPAWEFPTTTHALDRFRMNPQSLAHRNRSKKLVHIAASGRNTGKRVDVASCRV